MDTDSFTIHTKIKNFYKDFPDDVEKGLIHQIMKSIWCALQERKKVIRIMKDEVGGKIRIDRICCIQTKN